MIIPKEKQEQYLQKAKTNLFENYNPKEIWDPAYEVPTKEEIIEENKKTKAQQLYLEENIDEINNTITRIKKRSTL